jgi:hypothetical protein
MVYDFRHHYRFRIILYRRDADPGALRLCAGRVSWLSGDIACAAASAHAFDVGNECDLRHLFGWFTILGFTAVTCATINVVGGFMITDRMLRMFKRKVAPAKELAAKDGDKEKR